MGEKKDAQRGILGLSDEAISNLTENMPETPSRKLNNFLENYDEADKIAGEMVRHGLEINESKLQKQVVELIKRKAGEYGYKIDELDIEESLKSDTLKDDYPSWIDFIDFVSLAVEEHGGKITKAN